MKQIISRKGWLVMAAAFMMGMSLTTGLTSCSSDDDVTQTAPQGVSTIHVSVGASVADAGTRSTVETTTDGGKTTSTLQFTTGDRLYVHHQLTQDWPRKFIAGFLENKSMEDGTTATFEGDLNVYVEDSYQNEQSEWVFRLAPSTYEFGDSDPLVGATAILFHEGAKNNTMFIDDETLEVTFSAAAMASSVDDLMTSLLKVEGTYNTTTQQFSLSPSAGCIVNCTITDMTLTGDFTVSYWSGSSLTNLIKQTEKVLTKATANSDFTFAFFGKTGGNYYHQIRIESATHVTKVINLGQKTLASGSGTNKIVNVSRSWGTFSITSNTSTPVPDYVNNAYTFTSGCNINVSGAGTDKMIVLQGSENYINIENLAVINTSTENYSGNFIMPYNPSGNPVTTTINITGDNSISCLADGKDPIAEGSMFCTVKFSGKGTLTVTSKSPNNCGIYASNYTSSNNQNDVTGECDVTAQLAATGYSVIRSARTTNADGTYTWTYTVSMPFSVTKNGSAVTPSDWGVYLFGAYTFGEGDNFVARGITDNARLDFWDYPVYLTLNNVEVNQNYAVGNFIDSNANSNSGTTVGLSTVITINGNNSVTLHSDPVSYGNNNAPANCINCVGGLALIGNGTLTITTADPDNCGIIAANYPADGEPAKSDAAYTFQSYYQGLGYRDQYTVTRSARINNGDGTYTWTYTVTPN